ncbi:glycoside hydrolase [Winogradskyella sp. DF17]|uniref:Glycoside hydrolase n=1 Tax=Winogradskyella pelagia TaxID=2819984 RepID=A0ABS3SZ02_9FLAO|nr:glycoside hydrolase [Winogradskyella sp. DF17]MBO3115694.1 glycoside hydrolase [Winogradskyella sp. DF17]
MRILFFSLITVLLLGCAAAEYKPQKINGVSFVAARDAIDSTHVNPVIRINSNYAAIMPFGFIRQLDNPEIIHNTDRQWFGETRAGAKQYIVELRKANLRIMLKPQIWVWRGEFTGEIMMSSEENWEKLESSYTNFIMEYANLAEEVDAEIFCIGTELELFVKFRPEYWTSLIAKIRLVYKGELTYAANWDEFRRTPFWNQLDYIGIDAYFPVSDEKTPSVEHCLEGWKKHKPIIKQVSKENSRPVLFTEYGYRSVDFSAERPWVFDRKMANVNLEAQNNAMMALYAVFWDEDWFAGGFIWKWFHKDEAVGGEDNFMFTPQNKPVELIIKNHYGKYRNP